jgi:hypothetical protein
MIARVASFEQIIDGCHLVWWNGVQKPRLSLRTTPFQNDLIKRDTGPALVRKRH